MPHNRVAALVAVLAVAALPACGAVSTVDPGRYRLGYTAGARFRETEPTPDAVVNACTDIADAMAKKLGWDSGERLDYMRGCQDAAHGRQSDYP